MAVSAMVKLSVSSRFFSFGFRDMIYVLALYLILSVEYYFLMTEFPFFSQSVETLGYVIFSFHFLYYLCLNSIFYVLFGFFLFRQSDSVQLCSLVFPTPLITWCVILSESPSVLCCVQFPSYSLVPGFSSPELFSYVVFC